MLQLCEIMNYIFRLFPYLIVVQAEFYKFDGIDTAGFIGIVLQIDLYY